MGRFPPAARVASVVVVCLALAGCGGGGSAPVWTRAATRACLVSRGLHPQRVQQTADLVASTATNGALHVPLRGNGATILFGADDAEAERLGQAYARVAPKDYVAPRELNRNVLIQWQIQPSDAQARAVRECLRSDG